jgi:hypothetical protein
VARIVHPEWRASNEPTKYPFAERAKLTNGTDIILEGIFLDAILYPIGGQARIFLSRVDIEHDSVTVSIGDPSTAILASGTFDILSPPSRVKLTDTLGRPAGLLVSEPLRLATFQSWTVGAHTFDADETEFAATVAVPTPEVGVRGIQLEDGSLFTGEVWIVGDDGVVVRSEPITAPGKCGEEDVPLSVIRVDIVGDPLFRRRLCTDAQLFETPRFVRCITVTDGKQSVKCLPDAFGDFKITVGNDLAEDTVLRIRATPEGIIFEAVGDPLEGVR